MRPFLRWFLFTLCLLVFTGAMVWISLRMLEMETLRQASAQDAQRQEKIRLALWRMDSLASALLIRENSRPAYHYQAFYAPDDLFASRSQSIPKGQALMPSPLFGSLPAMVQLHFEKVGTQPSLSSPQAPMGSQRELATSWYNLGPQTSITAQKLARLDALLRQHPEAFLLPAIGATPMIELKPPAPPENQKTAQAATGLEELQVQQSFGNRVEQNKRAMILDNNIALEKKEQQTSPLRKTAPMAKASKADKAVASGKNKNVPSLAESPDLDAVASRYQSQEGTSSSMADTPPAPAPARQSLPALAGDLRPLWVENELLLIRHANVEGTPRLQGVWIDWTELQAQLLDNVRDLLPNATLKAVSPTEARTDESALVTLPVKIIAGNVPVALLADTSALKPALVIAWACLIAAAAAIAYVLHRAVLLSERRGAFVSAVTHELRTPLTTFRLYSEMLADDMVPDAAQRRSYLQTLCDESTRLMHLVENVLAYSRIEKGRTAGRMEDISIDGLLGRLLPRLRQRLEQADLTLHLSADEAALSITVRVDAMAVEQILFNLADNACKYAAPDCEQRQVDLKIEASPSVARFTFRDYGPGLPASQKKRLFQPFSKSATEAAHSAPGVGLGLALSRQLARELGGELACIPVAGRGTAFQLTVKTA